MGAGRKAKQGEKRRVQIRLDSDLASLFDRFNSDQLGEIVSWALQRFPMSKVLSQQAPTLLMPEKPITKASVRVWTQNTLGREQIILKVDSYDEKFVGLAKIMGFSWDEEQWVKTLDSDSGNIIDPTASAVGKLLESGFPVCIFNNTIRDVVVKGKYRSESGKKVDCIIINDTEYFRFIYTRDHDHFNDLKTYCHASYIKNKRAIVVNQDFYEEVVDFAEKNQFEFTKSATDLLVRAKMFRESAWIVSTKTKEEEILEPIIDEQDIYESLCDEDSPI